MPDRKIESEIFFRTLTLDRAQANDETRTVPAALSSELPVSRWFGQEVLAHEEAAIDMARTGDGLPMLFNHNSDQPIGLIRNIRLEDKRLRGDLHFSRNSKANDVWPDVRDGFLKDISIGYQVQKWEEESDSDMVRVTRWMPLEASVVSVPADHTVGINRSHNQGGSHMPEVTTPGSEAAEQNEVVNVQDFKINRERNLKDGEKRGVKEERKRISEVRRIFGPHLQRGSEYADLMDECIDKGVPISRSTDALLELLAGEHEPLAGEYTQDEQNGSMDRQTVRDVAPARAKRGEVTAGTSDMQKFMEGVEQALLVKAGIITDKEIVRSIRGNEFHSMSLSELPREYLRRAGDKVSGGKLDIVGKALTRDGIISHGTSDFANLLANVANKSLQIGWEEAPETWQAWCRTGSIPDFRQATRPNLQHLRRPAGCLRERRVHLRIVQRSEGSAHPGNLWQAVQYQPSGHHQRRSERTVPHPAEHGPGSRAQDRRSGLCGSDCRHSDAVESGFDGPVRRFDTRELCRLGRRTFRHHH